MLTAISLDFSSLAGSGSGLGGSGLGSLVAGAGLHWGAFFVGGVGGAFALVGGFLTDWAGLDGALASDALTGGALGGMIVFAFGSILAVVAAAACALSFSFWAFSSSNLLIVSSCVSFHHFCSKKVFIAKM